MVMLASCTAFIIQTALSATCPSGIVTLDVKTSSDVQTVINEVNCTGPGNFNITWHSSLQIEQRIDVFNHKNITVNGSGHPRIRAAPMDANDVESSNGLFSVSDESILRLSHLTLDGGNASFGGAVSMSSSSSLFLVGCTFASNHASEHGGERTRVGVESAKYRVGHCLSTSLAGVELDYTRLAPAAHRRINSHRETAPYRKSAHLQPTYM